MDASRAFDFPKPESKSVSEQKLSELFCAPNADVVFVSSDDVLFKVHGAYLNLAISMIFAKVFEDTSFGTDPVQLTERADVLEILFRFIELPSPSVLDMEQQLFFEVAEAAEKYVVYGLMNVCFTRMQQIYANFPLEVLNHCAMHGYSKLTDQAAEKALRYPLNKVVLTLKAPALLAQYVMYYTNYRRAGKKIGDKIYWIVSRTNCHIWTRIYGMYYQKVERNPLLFDQIPSVENVRTINDEIVCTDEDDECPCDTNTMHKTLQKECVELRKTIPKFSAVSL
ncbi:hypothetical protein BDN70DRAFT_975056 [Pholiota conissans]|uniref:BTB domain-containing protein n=1 Tax=Pholiota conissans TaxID=109636 RepID=A0A9P5YMK9_9AGAR|nr:hypothetical protein BDN70DRAFT_975056 [Pholiota conissans]